MLTVQLSHAVLTVQPSPATLIVQPPHAMLTVQSTHAACHKLHCAGLTQQVISHIQLDNCVIYLQN